MAKRRSTAATEEKFLQAILEAPDDDAPRLMYADWLTEHGDPRGDFIRLQCLLATIDETDERWWELKIRERLLIGQHGKGWAGPLRRLVKRWQFHRGFVEGVTLRAADFIEKGSELFRLAPIRNVRLLDAVAVITELSKSPNLAKLTGLDFRHQDVTGTHLSTLMRSGYLEGLTSLNLRGTFVCNDVGFQFLAACDKLAELSSLDLSQHRTRTRRQQRRERLAQRISSRTMQLFVESPHLISLRDLRLSDYSHDQLPSEATLMLRQSSLFARLTSLDLGEFVLVDPPEQSRLQRLACAGIRVGQRGLFEATVAPSGLVSLNLRSRSQPRETWGRLFESAHLERLRSLSLQGCRIGNVEMHMLAESKAFPALRHLDLGRNRYNHSGLKKFAESPLCGQLQVLSLQGPGENARDRPLQTYLGDKGCRVLRAVGVRNLLELDLGNQRITDLGVETLAESKRLTGLMSLGLWQNGIGPRGVKALLESPRLRRLVELNVRSNHLPDSAKEALRERFGPGVRYGPGPDVS